MRLNAFAYEDLMRVAWVRCLLRSLLLGHFNGHCGPAHVSHRGCLAMIIWYNGVDSFLNPRALPLRVLVLGVRRFPRRGISAPGPSKVAVVRCTHSLHLLLKVRNRGLECLYELQMLLK